MRTALHILCAACLLSALAGGRAAAGDWRDTVYAVEGPNVVVVGKGLGSASYAEAKQAALEDAQAELVRQTGVELSFSIRSEKTEVQTKLDKRAGAAGGVVLPGVTLIDEQHREGDGEPPRHDVWVRLRVSRAALEGAKRERQRPQHAAQAAAAACETAALGDAAAGLAACAAAIVAARTAGQGSADAEAHLLRIWNALTLRADGAQVTALREGRAAPGLTLSFVDAHGAALGSGITGADGRLAARAGAAYVQLAADDVESRAGLHEGDALTGQLRAAARAHRMRLVRKAAGPRVAVVVRERVFGETRADSSVAAQLVERFHAAGFRVNGDDAPRTFEGAPEQAVGTLRSAYAGRADLLVVAYVDVLDGGVTQGFAVARAEGAIKVVRVADGEVVAAAALRDEKGLAPGAGKAAIAALERAADGFAKTLEELEP